jgi:CPA1 family monovalent cation:H+ antiporter
MIAAVGPLLALARWLALPPSLLLFGVGIGSTFIPGFADGQPDPDLVLTLFLPPLLYASTVRVSWHLLRFNWRSGVLLGSLLVMASIAAVAVAAQALFLPGIGWSAAILMAITASFFDTRLFHEAKGRPRVPRVIADTLKALELTARILLLATLGWIETSLTSGRVDALDVAASYLLDIPAGALLGVLVGRAAIWARQRIDPAPVEIAISIATPYAAALAAEALGISLVASIAAAALVVSAVRVDRGSGATFTSTEARVSATAFWEELSLMVASMLFLLAGRAVPAALAGLGAWPIWQVAAAAAGLLAVALAVQFCFALASTRLRPMAASLRDRKASAAAAAAVMTWSSTRSAIGLLIALSLPPALAGERDLILAVSAFIVIGSVLVQGLTMKKLVDRAALADEQEGEAEEETARAAMQEAAEAPAAETATPHDAARKSLIDLRARDAIGDEVLIKMLREIDLSARASEQDVLPNAGPPNP